MPHYCNHTPLPLPPAPQPHPGCSPTHSHGPTHPQFSPPPPGLLVAGIGHVPCGGGEGVGPDLGGSTPEEAGGGASAEAPPMWPRLRELLQRHLREERMLAWVR